MSKLALEIEGFQKTINARQTRKRADELVLTMGEDLARTQERLWGLVKEIAGSDDQLDTARGEVAALDPLVSEAEEATRWLAELSRRQALAASLEDLRATRNELQSYVRFREERRELIGRVRAAIAEVSTETATAQLKLLEGLQRIAAASYEEQKRELQESALSTVFRELSPAHVRVLEARTELQTAFFNAGLHDWYETFWGQLIADFPDLRILPDDIDEGLGKVYHRSRRIGERLFYPPARSKDES